MNTKERNKKMKRKNKTKNSLASHSWYMYCVVSVYDKRVKNYYQSMIWITFAPLTILLLKFFYHYILFIYFVSFRLDDRTFSLSVWHASIHYVYHIYASVSSLSLLFIVALSPSSSDVLVCVLWHVSCNHYCCRLPRRLLICSIFLYHFRSYAYVCVSLPELFRSLMSCLSTLNHDVLSLRDFWCYDLCSENKWNYTHPNRLSGMMFDYI